MLEILVQNCSSNFCFYVSTTVFSLVNKKNIGVFLFIHLFSKLGFILKMWSVKKPWFLYNIGKKLRIVGGYIYKKKQQTKRHKHEEIMDGL